MLGFVFPAQRRRYWIVKDAAGALPCTRDPGFGVGVSIESDLATMYQVWLGRRDLRATLRNGSVVLRGAQVMVRRIPAVLLLGAADRRQIGAAVGRSTASGRNTVRRPGATQPEPTRTTDRDRGTKT